MRKIIRQFFITLLLGSIFFILVPPTTIWNFIQKFEFARHTYDFKTRSSITYLLEQNRSLRFAIPNISHQLKFLFIPNISKDLNHSFEIKDLLFDVEYSLLDAQKNPIVTKTVYLKTNYGFFVDNNNTLIQKKFYETDNILPCLGKELRVNLIPYPNASQITLRLKTKDKRVVDVVLKSYFLEQTPLEKRFTRWKRMAVKKREHLARGNIFPPSEMLTQEKEQLMSALWRPNGALGIFEEEYTTRRIFSRVDLEDIYPYFEPHPSFYANQQLHATRIVEKGSYALTFKALSPYPSHIQLDSYVDNKHTLQKFYALNSTSKTVFFDLNDSSLIEIQSTQPISMSMRSLPDNIYIDLPPVTTQDYYLIEHNTSLTYHFFSPIERYIRIEARNNDFNSSCICVTLRDENGTLIDSHPSKVAFIPSLYDYIDPYFVQSEPSYIYLYLSSSVHSIELNAMPNVYVRVATRSDKMKYPLYSAFAFGQIPAKTRKLGWFALRPKNFQALEVLEANIKFYKQKRPPLPNLFIQEGAYEYEQLFPNTPSATFSFLLKRLQEKAFIRNLSWQSIYAKLSLNRLHNITFSEDVGRKRVTPNLIYHKTSTKPLGFKAYLNDVIVTDKTLYHKTGVIPLVLRETQKQHQLLLKTLSSTQKLDAFVSHTISSSDDIYLQKSFLKFNKPLTLHFTKKSPTFDSLGFQLLIPKEINTTVSFTMKLYHDTTLKNIPYPTMTFHNHSINITPIPQEVISITNPNLKVSATKPAYLKLGENLTQGDYIMVLYPPKNIPNSYLFVNHLTVDRNEFYRFSKENL